uniref:Hexosyltransferase n=1 Tax=Alexandrium andersonii TaxID=327968 RepID=A0A7S2H2R0_9DINO
MSSLISLSRSLERPRECSVHIVVSEEDADAARDLLECFRVELGTSNVPAVQVHALSSEAVPFDPSRITSHPHLSHSKSAFFRFYLGELLPEVDRVLYLDTDTIVRADVGQLYRMPMEHAIACVHERALLDKFLLVQSVNTTSLLQHMPDRTLPQLQTGVALLDLQKWRADGIAEALTEWPKRLGAYNVQMIFGLEFHFQRGHDTLDEAWDLYGLGLHSGVERWISATPDWTPAQLAAAKILHYSGSKKPWSSRSRNSKTAMYQDLYAPYAPRHQCNVLSSQV